MPTWNGRSRNGPRNCASPTSGSRLELEERRRAERQLRENEERFRNLANRAPVGIWVTDADRLVTFYNRRALAFLGRKPAAHQWTDFVHPDDLEMVRAKYLAAVAARRSFRIECRVRRTTGKYRWMLHTGIPRFVGGVYDGHIGTSLDITDIKRAHERTMVNQKLESLGVLAGGVAHDFNNLLGSILAESDLALSDLAEDVPARGNLERIAAIATRASEIVNLLMTYAGERDLTIEAVDLSKITAEVLFLIRPPLKKPAAIEVNLDKDLPAVQANAAQIRQVVLNLITNASEALKGNPGTITVSTGQVQSERPPPRSANSICLPVNTATWRCPTPVVACPRRLRPKPSTRFTRRSSWAGFRPCRGSGHPPIARRRHHSGERSR